MNVALQHTRAEQALLDAYPSFREAVALSPWLDRQRAAGYSSFAAVGLPHRRIEEWKWTDLRRALTQAYLPLVAPAVAPSGLVDELLARAPFAGLETFRLVFVDGRFDPTRSAVPSAEGFTFATLAGFGADVPDWVERTLGRLYGPEADPIAAMNAAFLSDGAAIHLAENAKVERPVEIVSVVTDPSVHLTTLRNVIVLEKGASLTLVETHLGVEGDHVANAVTEVRVGEGAVFNRVKVQQDGRKAIHLSNVHVELQAEATLNEFAATVGAGLSRNQIFARFNGQHAQASIGGTYLLAGRQHCDTTLVVNHAVPECSSRELFKAVLDHQARGVFQGKLIVEKYAQKTDAKQQSHGLLLSETAEFDAKPELEIYADDVACGHGATAGQIDENLVFYLMARGIPKDQAMALLVAAFAAEAFEAVVDDDLRERLSVMAEGWLINHGDRADG